MTATEPETMLPPGYQRCRACEFLPEPDLDVCPVCGGMRLVYVGTKAATPWSVAGPLVALPCAARAIGVRFVPV